MILPLIRWIENSEIPHDWSRPFPERRVSDARSDPESSAGRSWFRGIMLDWGTVKDVLCVLHHAGGCRRW